MMEFDWLHTRFNELSRDYQNMHHSQLISGPKGIGKAAFAVALSKLLLCQQPTSTQNGHSACNQCQDCRLFAAGTHPDFHLICSENLLDSGYLQEAGAFALRYHDSVARAKRTQASQFITIEQIRRLIRQFTEQPHISTRKVALLVDAETMNVNAANSLLKLLEEPPANSFILLVSSTPGLLLPTIRSRVIWQRLPAPEAEQGRQWLQKNSVTLPANDSHLVQSPVLCRHQFTQGQLAIRDTIGQTIKSVFLGKLNAVEAASALNKEAFADVITVLDEFTQQLIKYVFKKKQNGSEKVTSHTAQSAFLFYDEVLYYRQLQKESINKQLALEALLTKLQALSAA